MNRNRPVDLRDEKHTAEPRKSVLQALAEEGWIGGGAGRALGLEREGDDAQDARMLWKEFVE